TKMVRLTSSSILSLLGTNVFPSAAATKGYSLIYNPIDSTLGATNSKTGDFIDLSSTLSIDTSGTSVNPGSINSATGKEGETYTIYAVISFDNGSGTAFSVSGLVKQTVTVATLTTAQLNNGDSPTETVSISGSFSGTGTIVGSDGSTDAAVFSG